MFEASRLTQPQIADILSSQIAQGALPRAALFTGPAYSGRMVAAYELARALGSLKDGAFAVSSPRDFRPRVQLAIESFRRSPGAATGDLLRQNLDCYLAQFSGLLATDEKDQKQYDRAADIREVLEELDSVPLSGLEQFCDRLGRAFEASCKLMASLKSAARLGLLNIAQARALKQNLQLTSIGKGSRVVVIEGLGDANESTKNSLLKLLEEPPEKVCLVLVSSRPERILPTILSRTRQYRFPAIGAEAQAALLASWGLDAGPGGKSLEERFTEGLRADAPLLRRAAEAFLDEGKADLPALFKSLEGVDGADAFLKALSDALEGRCRAGRITAWRAREALHMIDAAAVAVRSYNQNPRLAVEALLDGLREELGSGQVLQ